MQDLLQICVVALLSNGLLSSQGSALSCMPVQLMQIDAQRGMRHPACISVGLHIAPERGNGNFDGEIETCEHMDGQIRSMGRNFCVPKWNKTACLAERRGSLGQSRNDEFSPALVGVTLNGLAIITCILPRYEGVCAT